MNNASREQNGNELQIDQLAKPIQARILSRWVLLICSICCKNFYRPRNHIRKNTVKHYCSEYCRANRVKWTNLNCLKCGKEFAVPPNQENRARYCSKECMKSKIKCICQTCGKWFYRQLNQIRSGEGKYCSRICRFTGLMRNCVTCGKEFYVKKHRINDPIRGKYCSKKCRYFKVECRCITCGKLFMRSRIEISKKGGKFCSHKCYSLNGSTNVNCNVCGREYKIWKTHYRRGIFKQCSKECRDKTILSPFQMLIRSTERYRNWRKLVFQRDGHKCQECGKKTGELHVHHIFAFAEILERNRIWSVEEANNCKELWNAKNGRTLCLQCHTATYNYGNGRH
jgi:hypothetical protein